MTAQALPVPIPAAIAPREAELPSVWNEYLGWLSFAVPGMLWRGNIDAMAYALQRLPAGLPLVEIGSFCGLSTCVLTYLKQKCGVAAPLFTSDAWGFEGQALGRPLGDSPTLTHDDYRAFVRNSFLRNTGHFCGPDLPYTVELDSDAFFAEWRAMRLARDVFGRPVQLGGPIAFCYIDGNHSYDFAKRDFENTDRWLCSGGFVLFDDSADGSGWEVCRVVQEIVASGRYELISRNPNYLFQKK